MQSRSTKYHHHRYHYPQFAQRTISQAYCTV